MNPGDWLAHWWPGLLLGPALLGGALAFVWPRLGFALGQGVALLNALAAVLLVWRVAVGGPLAHAAGGWPAPLGIGLRLDGLAVLMVLAAALVAWAGALNARSYFRAHGQAPEGFWPLWLFLMAALNGLFISADLFNLYVMLELTGLAAVGLVVLGGGTDSLAAALRYLLVGLGGSLCYLLGVGLMYGAYGTVDLPLLASQASGPALGAALALMTAGLFFKAGIFPFHFWLPPAHGGAPAPVSAMLSALVVEAAFYLLMRLWLELAPLSLAELALPVSGVLGSAAVVWGAVNALRAERLKLMIAYSTVSQLGYLFLALPLMPLAGAAIWSGAALLVLSHALAKGALFLGAGTVLNVVGHDRIRGLNGLAQRLPLTVAVFVLAAVSLIGLPPSGGFLAKWLLLNGAIAQGQWWAVAVLLVGSVLAGAYMFRVLGRCFTYGHTGGREPGVALAAQWPAFGLAAAAVALGLAGSWVGALALAGSPFEGDALLGVAP